MIAFIPMIFGTIPGYAQVAHASQIWNAPNVYNIQEHGNRNAQQ
jgi:hypothetical protein